MYYAPTIIMVFSIVCMLLALRSIIWWWKSYRRVWFASAVRYILAEHMRVDAEVADALVAKNLQLIEDCRRSGSTKYEVALSIAHGFHEAKRTITRRANKETDQ